MPIYSSTIQDLVANKSPQPYYRLDGIYDNGSPTSSDKIDLGDVGFIDDLTQFSVSVWFKAESSAQNDVVIFSKDNQIECWIKWDSNNRYALSVNNDHVDFTSSSTPFGEWVHVVYTWNMSGDVRKVYQNGVFIQSGSGDEDGVDINSGNVGLSIGARDAGHYPTNAEISNIRFYNKELSATEVSEVYGGASVPFKYKGANQTEMMTGGDCSADNWNPESTWTHNSGTGKYDADGSSGDTIGKDVSVGTITIGKAYKVEFDVTNYVTGYIKVNVGAYGGSGQVQFTGNGHSVQIVTPTHASSNQRLYLQAFDSYEGSIDNISMVPAGAVAEYDGSGILSDTWLDKSGNDLHGAVRGATAENLQNPSVELFYQAQSVYAVSLDLRNVQAVGNWIMAQNMETGYNYVTGKAPDGFTGISAIKIGVFNIQGQFASQGVRMKWEIASDEQGYQTHTQGITTVRTFPGTDTAANTIFEADAFNLTGTNDFEDIISPGDYFGMAFDDLQSHNSAVLGVGITWEF